jgi:hypothetical protein
MYFQIADMIPPVEGIDLGGNWNGWRRPAFPKASAEQIASAHDEHYRAAYAADGPGPEGAYAWHDQDANAYVFFLPDSGETETFRAFHGVKDVYWQIGTDGWTWEACPVVRVTFTIDVVGSDSDTLDNRANAILDNGEIQALLDPLEACRFLDSTCDAVESGES